MVISLSLYDLFMVEAIIVFRIDRERRQRMMMQHIRSMTEIFRPGTIRRKKKPNRNQNFSDGEVSHGERSVHDAAYCTYRVLTNVFI